MRAIILLIFLSAHATRAMDFRHGKLDDGLKIKNYDRSEDALVREVEVMRGEKVIFTYRPGQIGRLLVESGLIQPQAQDKGPYLVSVWHKGAHSQILHVHDLGLKGSAEDKEILRCRTTSAWPMSIDVNEKRIVVRARGSEIDPKTGTPAIKVSTCEL